VRALAAEAARNVGRRLRARRGGHARPQPVESRPEPAAIPLPQAPRTVELDPRVAEAELDALRGALVRELDRLAADDGCSASFRRAG
jgi:hypothetical protein